MVNRCRPIVWVLLFFMAIGQPVPAEGDEPLGDEQRQALAGTTRRPGLAGGP